MYLIDKSIRKNTAHQRAMLLKRTLEHTFNGLLNPRHIQSFREKEEHFKKQHFVFHIKYECVIKYKDDSKKVTFLFDLDIRDSTEKVLKEEYSSSNASKFSLSPDFEQKALFEKLRNRIVQWRNGVERETNFMEFLNDLQQGCKRIDRVYKTGKYDDGKNGVDFGVVILTKPHYEHAEIRFNLKASDNYLEKHKANHPNVGTFIFKNNPDLVTLERRKMLTRRFMKFLLLSAESREAVHM